MFIFKKAIISLIFQLLRPLVRNTDKRNRILRFLDAVWDKIMILLMRDSVCVCVYVPRNFSEHESEIATTKICVTVTRHALVDHIGGALHYY